MATRSGKPRTDAEKAVHLAGWDAPRLAKRMNRSTRYILRILHHGTDCLATAIRIQRITGCKIDLLIHPRKLGTNEQQQPGRENEPRPALRLARF